MLTVKILQWQKASSLAYPVRYTVFVKEQGVPKELELDDDDPLAWHALLFNGESPIGTARLLPSGKIGRLAVLQPYRGQGYGTMLMQALITHGKEGGIAHFYLHAQTTALAFYERLGFRANGPVFNEAGIAHIRMEQSFGFEAIRKK